MPDNQYPVFEGGQTLTAEDLNRCEVFGHHRDRLLGRLTGFGVNCGLGGKVSGTTLTIDPGLAIDQVGEPLILPAAADHRPAAGASRPASTSSTAGARRVLRRARSRPTRPAGAGLRPDGLRGSCRAAHTRVPPCGSTAGRITGPRFDFAGETLLASSPCGSRSPRRRRAPTSP